APQESPGQQVETVTPEPVAVPVPVQAHDPAAPVSPLAASPAVTPAADVPADINGDEVVFTFGDRRYRVRGLPKNLSPETLKINLLVSSGTAYYVDTLDLYSARNRNQYLLYAAKELAVRDDLIKHDLGRILLK